ncbi:MAG: aminotransferase class V-fold PLP-dependent enzyme [Longimicrobiales bacterium]
MNAPGRANEAAGPLRCEKDRFTLPADIHYLNCAYMGPLTAAAQHAGVEAIARKGVPHTIGPADFFTDSDRARSLFARLIHADASRIAIIPAVSYGIATVARNANVSKGDNIVVLAEQFPSNVHAWRRLAVRNDAELRTVAAPRSARRGEEWNAAVFEAIDDATAVVALPQVHWTDGTRFDLVRIGVRAREVGALFVIDGSQSIGAHPFDVTEIQPDAVICAAYKWLLGPYSVGLAYYGSRLDDGEPLEETWIGRRDSEDFRGLIHYRDEYQPGAVRYDVGERSNFILVPMMNAALEQVVAWTPERIQQYCERLMGGLIEEARALGFTLEDAAWRGAHLFGLRTPAGLDLEALQHALQERNISVSLRGSALRVSPNVYNDDSDAEALHGALRAAVTGRGTGAASPSPRPGAAASAR